MVSEPGYVVPTIDWDRTSGRVLTLEWIDGIKISDREALIAAGHDVTAIAARLVNAFLRQAISDGFFHADMHQGNLFVTPNGNIAAIDFGIMGRIDRRAPGWLAELLYGQSGRGSDKEWVCKYLVNPGDGATKHKNYK